MDDMREQIRFILNDTSVCADVFPGAVLTDYIRYTARLTGTKIGCREGDCGACTVLVGELRGTEIAYANVTSCLMPMGNVAGKHVVTVEGVDLGGRPNAVQAAFVAAGAIQCGFCTPGFIVSLTGACLSGGPAQPAISGNICRCTGYKSIERAIGRLAEHLSPETTLSDLIRAGVVPAWFANIPKRLVELQPTESPRRSSMRVGGGTDLFVQRPSELRAESLTFNLGRSDLRQIRREADTCIVGASVTMEELGCSPLMVSLFPDLPQYTKLIASQAIRNMATIAGNFANASPIGDMTVFFLALDSSLALRRGDRRRTVRLREFFRGYKQLDLDPDEEIENVSFDITDGSFFNFEKVSKRTHLDIASVNSAMSYSLQAGIITSAHCAAGGVAPIPLYLAKTSAFLIGKPLDAHTVRQAARIADGEIAPISDVRGSADYKRLLLRQLIFAHFLAHFSDRLEWEALA